MANIKETLELMFGFTQTVPRRTYLAVGFGLGGLKYALDVLLVWLVTQEFWTPLSYLMPVYQLRAKGLGIDAHGTTATMVLGLMALYTLPFLWVGLTMSVRRAADAGLSPWVGIFFLVPGLNWLMILALSVIETRSEWSWQHGETVPAQLGVALTAVALGIAQTLGMVALNVYIFGQYGWVLFLTTPCVVGLLAGYLLNRTRIVKISTTLNTAGLTILLSGLSLLLFAFEGIICIAMATPLALLAGGAGALAGRAIAVQMLERSGSNHLGVMLVMLALPVLAGAESSASLESPLYEVSSAVIIDATPDEVWHEVIHFSELPPAPAWVQGIGIAYPIRARLQGRGVGAVRHCEFSTGAFVEPITVWEPGRRLAFTVESQPMPMEEWSPYAKVHPPHLDGYWRSKRGEFRLTALPDGRTRLEGSTWYELDMAPGPYWRLIANGVIHGIHLRVLDHVRVQVESRARLSRRTTRPDGT